MKLATLLGERMRDLSDFWAPPIYRRLVSVDKREREISERCLLKIKSIICPAPVVLCKVKLRFYSFDLLIFPLHLWENSIYNFKGEYQSYAWKVYA